MLGWLRDSNNCSITMVLLGHRILLKRVTPEVTLRRAVGSAPGSSKMGIVGSLGNPLWPLWPVCSLVIESTAGTCRAGAVCAPFHGLTAPHALASSTSGEKSSITGATPSHGRCLPSRSPPICFGGGRGLELLIGYTRLGGICWRSWSVMRSQRFKSISCGWERAPLSPIVSVSAFVTEPFGERRVKGTRAVSLRREREPALQTFLWRLNRADHFALPTYDGEIPRLQAPPEGNHRVKILPSL
jgi:hypothetical protein